MLKNRPKSPIGVEIKLTNECNSKCLHCIAKSYPGSGDFMDRSLLDEVISKIADAGIFYVGLTGGEPLLYKDLFYTIEKLREKNIEVGVTTNALLVNEDIVRKFKNLGINFVRISLDSDNEKENDSFRGIKGHFNSVGKAVKLFNEQGINVVILSVISKYNINNLEKIILRAREFGAAAINCYSLVPGGRAESLMNLMFSPQEYRDFLLKVIELKEKYSSRIDVLTETPLMNVLKDESNHVCLAGNAQLFIKENGEVIPCPYMEDYSLGNIREKTIEEIWKDENLLKLVSRDFLSNECRSCDHGEACFGGCRAAAFYKEGRINEKDPFCWVKNESK